MAAGTGGLSILWKSEESSRGHLFRKSKVPSGQDTWSRTARLGGGQGGQRRRGPRMFGCLGHITGPEVPVLPCRHFATSEIFHNNLKTETNKPNCTGSPRHGANPLSREPSGWGLGSARWAPLCIPTPLLRTEASSRPTKRGARPFPTPEPWLHVGHPQPRPLRGRALPRSL